MHRKITLLLLGGSLGIAGCASHPFAVDASSGDLVPRHSAGVSAGSLTKASVPLSYTSRDVVPSESLSSEAIAAPAKSVAQPIQPVAFTKPTSTPPVLESSVLESRLLESPLVRSTEPPTLPQLTEAPAYGVEVNSGGPVSTAYVAAERPIAIPENIMQINLPTALARIDGQHPVVGIAQWRVQEAYARLSEAEVLWLPTIQAGLSFHRHDGNYQASNGDIVDVNRNSFQYGLGNGATGAGTTPRPGLVAQFHLADALFQPAIAEKTAWAQGHAAKATMNTQLLDAATAYMELLNAHQDSQILIDSRTRTAELEKITSDFAAAGEGLTADSNRLSTELMMVENRQASAAQRIAIAEARLAQALSISGDATLLPMDATVVPLDLASPQMERSQLIQTGLANRPELKESQALVAAACEAFQREKYSQFVPSVLLGFSTGGFGGGLSNNLDNVESRYDFDAALTWQVRNLGFGERAVKRQASARVQQARYEQLRVMDEIALDISEAFTEVQFRQQQIGITQRAIDFAQSSYELNLARIRDGQGLPLEILQSVQALEAARRAYLEAVVGYNQSQFRLQWALGWPVAS